MLAKTGLVLEGGAVRGVFSSGAIDYMLEKELYIPYVVGVSAGACNAIDYASKQIGRTFKCMVPDEEYRYINSIKKTILNKSLFDMDLLFDDFPNKIYPFDFDTYKNSDIVCELVTTNCETGKAEYFSETNDYDKLLKICRASSSMPLVSPMVDIDGVSYLDGGLADSVPIIHSLKLGNKKNVIILTRNKGYRKKYPNNINRIYIATFKKYPNLIRTIYYRSYVYNKTMDYIDELEKKGRVFVLRPEIECPSRTETNKEKLKGFYNHGYKMMKDRYDELLKYLEI